MLLFVSSSHSSYLPSSKFRTRSAMVSGTATDFDGFMSVDSFLLRSVMKEGERDVGRFQREKKRAKKKKRGRVV